MEYLISIILVLFGVYMFSQPDNFYEYTKIRRKGPIETGDPTKIDYIMIRGGGIFCILAGIGSAIATFLA